MVGNENILSSSLASNNISIDANSPLINQISVSNGIYSIGDIVEVKIAVDGSNYTFDATTEVNGIPYSSVYLTSSLTGPNEYTLYYTVRSTDSEVEYKVVIFREYPLLCHHYSYFHYFYLLRRGHTLT